jgi:hypothetical protein
MGYDQKQVCVKPSLWYWEKKKSNYSKLKTNPAFRIMVNYAYLTKWKLHIAVVNQLDFVLWLCHWKVTCHQHCLHPYFYQFEIYKNWNLPSKSNYQGHQYWCHITTVRNCLCYHHHMGHIYLIISKNCLTM